MVFAIRAEQSITRTRSVTINGRKGEDMAANKALRKLAKRLAHVRKQLRQAHADIEGLESTMSEMSYEHDMDMSRAEERARQARYQAEEAERKRQDHQYEVESIARDLERAKSYGDSYGCERGIRRLKYL